MNAAYGGIFGDDGDDFISVVGDYMANLHGGEGDDTIHVDGYFFPTSMATFNGGGGTDTLCAMTDGVSDPHDYWDPGFGGAGWSNQAAGEFEIIESGATSCDDAFVSFSTLVAHYSFEVGPAPWGGMNVRGGQVGDSRRKRREINKMLSRSNTARKRPSDAQVNKM